MDSCVDVYYHLYIQNTRLLFVLLVADVSCTTGNGNGASRPKVAKLTNKGQFEHYTGLNYKALFFYK